ncbi:LPS-assembly protein LptD [Campylobacter estrildidarum]|uniref:LPS-assembly protein LptD n=1 Tax=Campylobacter estrildidarum TaxID=2510189 RepID=A0A4U7BIW8_9BACT|nr:LPS-assembly protein LptD [Campylobacter estrildidarum]TKX31803.1 LPS-assembly protein LptD [Campylobacter estrildidarum]
MWHKILLSLFFTSIFLNATQVDIYALDAKKEGDILTANNDVIVFSDFYFITANRAIYNQKSGDIELFGDVNILRGQNERSHSNYAKINLNSNEAYFNNFFFSNNNLEVWFQSKKSYLNDNFFESKISAVSSCNVEDPDWEIRFSKGWLNRKNNFVHLYNARLYVKNFPIFYLPYFGFSADTHRQSGLLVPKFFLKRNEGFYYEQPIYIATDENWDLQLNPQIRTDRGFGLYSTLRFVDSLYSTGELNFGGFKEKSSYYYKENLKNKIHSGIELKYARNNLMKALLGDNVQEGLWIDATYLNDIDYLNLSSNNTYDLASLVTSKINYFLADENNYYGAYAKYYIDTSKLSNKTTLQEYPSFQYHRFLNNLFDERLRYSFDATFHNFYRPVDPYANQINLELPISYHNTFFEDLLHFTFTESLFASFINYSKIPEKKHEYYFQNTHSFNFYTDLSKNYGDFFHTLNFGLEYLFIGAKSGSISENYLEESAQKDDQINFYTVQYFYNELGQKKLKHKFNLEYLNKKQHFDELKNLLTYYYNDYINFNNETFYSYEKQKFTNVINQIEFSTNFDFNWNFSHAYQNNEYGKYNFIGTRANYIVTPNYNLFGGIWLDTQRAHANMWELGYTFQRKCWNYSLMYRERIDPQLTSAGITAKNQSGVYFVFNFYPIGGIKYDFSLAETESKI